MLITVDGRTTVTIAKDPETAKWDRFQPRKHGTSISDNEKEEIAQGFENAWDDWVDAANAEIRAEDHEFEELYDDFRDQFDDYLLEEGFVPVNLDSMPKNQFYGWVISFLLNG